MDLIALGDFAGQVCEKLELKEKVSVVLLSERSMRQYNRCYAGKDYSTDVLSFPNESEPWEEEIEPYLGDILISVEQADRQKQDSLEREIRVLILHGLLHLAGYDHETDQGQMADLEDSLRKEFQLQ